MFGAWVQVYQDLHPDLTINYLPASLADAVAQFEEARVDFAVIDDPMTDRQMAAAGAANGAAVLQILGVLGGIVVGYNLPGVSELKLDSDTLAAMFLGEITRWDDPKLGALNPGITLPSMDIQVIHQKNPGHNTLIFTSYLSLVSTEWKSRVGAGRSVAWPVGFGVIQGSGISPEGEVLGRPGSIGYTTLGWAIPESGMQIAQLKNKSGNFIKPTLESAAAAAEDASVPADLRFSLLDNGNPQAYPIVHAVWILAHERTGDPARAAFLEAFLRWIHSPEGDAVAEKTGHAVLPGHLKSAVLAEIGRIEPASPVMAPPDTLSPAIEWPDYDIDEPDDFNAAWKRYIDLVSDKYYGGGKLSVAHSDIDLFQAEGLSPEWFGLSVADLPVVIDKLEAGAPPAYTMSLIMLLTRCNLTIKPSMGDQFHLDDWVIQFNALKKGAAERVRQEVALEDLGYLALPTIHDELKSDRGDPLFHRLPALADGLPGVDQLSTLGWSSTEWLAWFDDHPEIVDVLRRVIEREISLPWLR